jgi:large subunit ribosomal protein L30
MSGKIRVTQKRSVAGQLRNIRACVRGLGLRRIGHSVEVLDTPPNRGMIRAAGHLLVVEKA